MISVEQYHQAVLEQVEPLPTQRVPITAAHGLRLAEDVTARLAVPPFDNSAMDGFAVRAADLAGVTSDRPGRLPVAGDLPAGVSDLPGLAPGTALRIMTGGPMPPGADAVVPVEHTDQPLGAADLPDVVEIRTVPQAGAHVRRRGEDIRPGDPVLAAGVQLAAAQLSSAVSAGFGKLLVHPRPRVGVLATGDELAPPGAEPRPGQVPDSNSVLLAGLVREAGGEPVPLGPVGDEPEDLRRLVARALPQIDALVTSGGVSVGTRDVVKAAFAEELTFTQVAMQPGKPQGFGVLAGRVPVFALPGNPVSVFVSFHVHVAPALRQLLGLPAVRPLERAIAAVGWRCPPGRRQYQPVRVTPPPANTSLIPPADSTVVANSGLPHDRGTSAETRLPEGAPSRPGLALVRPSAAGGSGSHLVASLAAVEALAVVAKDVPEVAPGDEVGLLRW